MRARDERGMTLIEIIVSVGLTGIIAGVMLQATLVGIRNLDETNERMAGSNDTQLIAAHFTSDVASAEAISTTGTRSHAAPSVSPTVTNTALIMFWSLKRPTTVTLPEGMGPGWNTASTQFRIGMADEVTPGTGATGNRVLSSGEGTSSISHSVALAPAFLATITRRGFVSSQTAGAGAQQLTVLKPAGTAQNDTLLAHVAVAGGSETTVSAPGWTLVNSRISGTLKSLVFQKVAASGEPANYTFSFTGPGGAPVTRDAVIGVVAYSNVLTTGGVHKAALDVNPCGGETPVLLLSWTDRHANSDDDVSIQVAYQTVNVGTGAELRRWRCAAPSGAATSGLPTSEQRLASHLSPATAFASCVSSSAALATTTTTAPIPSDACGYLPVTVTMSLTEPPGDGESTGRTYLVRASTRTEREDG